VNYQFWAERNRGLSDAVVKRLMTNDYTQIKDVFLVIDPPDMELSNDQQLAIHTAADDLRHYEDERLALIFESGPFGTIAIIRKTAIEEVQLLYRYDLSVRTFADLLKAFKHAGYEIDRK
jgi:hypothetical protein